MRYNHDGMIFEIYDHYAVLIKLQKDYDKPHLSIPAFVRAVPVIEICEETCKDTNSIWRVSLPYTIQKIGNGAFWNCGNLEIVQLKNNSEIPAKLIVGKYAFANCKKLSAFHAKTEIDIKEGAFAYCSKLGLLDGCAKRVGYSAFDETPLDILMLAQNAEIKKNGLYGSNIKEIICIRDATFHESAIPFIQAKNINIHCPATSNIVDLAYLGVNVCTN